jgi:hypothetical protein
MRSQRSRILAALGLAVLAFLVYNANQRVIGAGDTFPARFLPLSVWRTGTTHLDLFEVPMNTGYETVFWTMRLKGHVHSTYPLVTPVLVTPLYGPAALYLSRSGWDPWEVRRVSGLMEKLCASLIAAASVAVVWLMLLGIASPRTALLLTLAYAFGTNTWMTSSQGLWQHGLGELLLALVLYAAGRVGTQPRWSLVAGVCCALMIFNRPADGLMVVAVSLYFLRPRTWKAFTGAGLLAGAPFLAYNLLLFGTLTGGYAYFNPTAHVKDAFPDSVAGLLVSPAKGLFVFAPFLALLLFTSLTRFADPDRKRLAVLLLFGLVCQIFVYARVQWPAGYCFGPRYLTGLLPLMIWLIAPMVDSMKRLPRFATAVLIVFSIAVQAVGAFYYPSSGIDAVQSRESWTLWHPMYNSVITDVRAGRMPLPNFN